MSRRRIVLLRQQAARHRECVRHDCFYAAILIANQADATETVLDVEACLAEAIEKDELADGLREQGGWERRSAEGTAPS